jgi:hypothetical protein
VKEKLAENMTFIEVAKILNAGLSHVNFCHRVIYSVIEVTKMESCNFNTEETNSATVPKCAVGPGFGLNLLLVLQIILQARQLL